MTQLIKKRRIQFSNMDVEDPDSNDMDMHRSERLSNEIIVDEQDRSTILVNGKKINMPWALRQYHTWPYADNPEIYFATILSHRPRSDFVNTYFNDVRTPRFHDFKRN